MILTEKLSGYIDHIIFQNEENGYTVLVLSVPGSREVTCIGNLPGVSEGMSIQAEGEYETHAVYGRQLRISSYTETAPKDKDAIERYLGSGAIKGIGPALAARIVLKFGEDTLKVVEE